MVQWLPPTARPDAPAPDLGAETHESRRALTRILQDPKDQPTWAFLARTYDYMSPDWSGWTDGQRLYVSPLLAGLSHVRAAAWALEVGCGTGQGSRVLAEVCPRVVATDINLSMLAKATGPARVRYAAADVRHLPMATASVPLLVGLNAVPHIGEFERVVQPTGQVLWCSSFGPGTPLYVSADDLLRLFGSGWRALAGHAGHGEWVLLTRR